MTKLPWHPATERPKMGRRIRVLMKYNKDIAVAKLWKDFYGQEKLKRGTAYTGYTITKDMFTHWIYESDFRGCLPK